MTNPQAMWQWEAFAEDRICRSYRMRVPNGWLVRVAHLSDAPGYEGTEVHAGMAMCFVPDSAAPVDEPRAQ